MESEETLYEVVGGRRVETPTMTAWASALASDLAGALGAAARASGLGWVVIQVIFDLGEAIGNWRRPDVAFVSIGRWPRGKRLPSTDPWAVVPDLAVEVVSPDDKAGDVIAKVREYLRAGVRIVWVLYSDAEELHAFDAAEPTVIRVVRRGDEIDGGAVVPGFRLPLAALFHGEPTEDGTNAEC